MKNYIKRYDWKAYYSDIYSAWDKLQAKGITLKSIGADDKGYMQYVALWKSKPFYTFDIHSWSQQGVEIAHLVNKFTVIDPEFYVYYEEPNTFLNSIKNTFRSKKGNLPDGEWFTYNPIGLYQNGGK